ncbi:MAG: DinB family protein [Acidobacteriaceae bacterium]
MRSFPYLALQSILFSLVLAAPAAPAQTPSTPPPSPTLSAVLDAQLTAVEKQFVPAAEAMPADKYDFAPSGANFAGVRTFALEVRHVATANFGFYSIILGQDPPPGVSLAGAGNGPDNLRTKDQILQYLRDSFALGHRALATLTLENALAPVPHPPIASMNTRLALATFVLWHANDHYGQMVEYLRMNGIVPPASQGQPPANPAPK